MNTATVLTYLAAFWPWLILAVLIIQIGHCITLRLSHEGPRVTGVLSAVVLLSITGAI